MKKLKFIFSVLVVAFCALMSGVIMYYDFAAEPTAATADEYPLIIIDAGHGGFDGGAVASDGTSEKDINLNIASTLSELFRASGKQVVMTRSTDTGTEDNSADIISKRKVSDLKNRLKLINTYENAIFVSVHLNKFTTASANGTQVFYSKNHSKSRDLGQCVQNSVVSQLQKNNTRVIKQATSSTYLLHNAQIPAVIVECGFLSNKEELKKLKSDEYQKQMAYSIFCGVLKYLEK